MSRSFWTPLLSRGRNKGWSGSTVDVAGRLVEDASLSILHCEWEDSAEGVSGFMSPPLLFSTYGRPFQAPFSPGVCSVQATRYDGLLPARSPVETVYIEAGVLSYTRLVLPPEKGGLGIQLGPALEGVEVVGVFEDSPAWEAGIEVGDIIAAVDGAQIDRLSLEDTAAPSRALSVKLSRSASFATSKTGARAGGRAGRGVSPGGPSRRRWAASLGFDFHC